MRTCIACSTPVVSSPRWYRERAILGPKGYRRHVGKGLCSTCYSRMRRRGTTDPAPRPRPPARGPLQESAEDVLEEYQSIRDSVDSIAQAAERMGVSFSKLDAALRRARRRGDPRGNAPLSQVERAIANGSRIPMVA